METNENDLIENNIKLAYKLAYTYHRKFNGKFELEDLQSICFLGLTKAAKSFNLDMNIAFSTYAYKCMQTELLYLYKKNKNNNWVSLSEKITDDIYLEDTIPSTTNTLEEDIENNIQIQQLYKLVEELEELDKKIILGYLRNLTTKEIANQLGLDVKQINFKYRRAINKLRYKFLRIQGGEL